MTLVLLRRVRTATATTPALTIYVTAVALFAAAARPVEVIRLDVAAVLLGIVVVVVILTSMHREVGRVHTLVNSQRDELVARIDQLTQLLVAAGQKVPSDPAAGGER